jgi:membrane-bound lytic murein transglycosylase D
MSKLTGLLASILVLVIFSCTEIKKEKIIKNKLITEIKSLPPIPDSMYFAGKKIILKDWDIKERLDKEILVNTYFQSATSQIIKRSHRWFPIIESILKKNQIHTDFKYLAAIESALVEQASSPVGAQGFWQFMPFTAKEFNLTITDEIDERLDVYKSTKAACEYLKGANDTLKDWILTAASYNRGVHGVLKDKSWQKAKSYFDLEQNDETGRYVYRILAMKIILENPEKYGYNIPIDQRYPYLKVRRIVVKNSISNLSDWALNKGINIKILRKLNPWLKSTKLTIKNKYYTLLLPLKTENLKPYHHYKN